MRWFKSACLAAQIREILGRTPESIARTSVAPVRVSTSKAKLLPNISAAFARAKYGPDLHEGEAPRIAKIPDATPFKIGDENPSAEKADEKADFYKLRYSPYLIGMNTTQAKNFELTAPQKARDLVGKKAVEAGQNLKVGPRSTTVFWSE